MRTTFVELRRLAGAMLLVLSLAGVAPVRAQGPGNVMRDPESPHVWFVDSFGVRHHVQNPGVLKRHWKNADMQFVPQAVIDQFPQGSSIDGQGSASSPGAADPGWFMQHLDPAVAPRHQGRADGSGAVWFEEHALPLPARVKGYEPAPLGPPLPAARQPRTAALAYRIDVQYRGFLKKTWEGVGHVSVRTEAGREPGRFTVELDLKARDPRAKQDYDLGLTVTFEQAGAGALAPVARTRRHQRVQNAYEHKILELMPFLHLARRAGLSPDRVERYRMGGRDYVLQFRRERGRATANLRGGGKELGKFFLGEPRPDGALEVARFRVATPDSVSVDFVAQ